MYNEQIRLRLLVLLLLWACHCDKQWEHLAAFLAPQPKLRELSLTRELEVLFQLSSVFTWELSFPDFPWIWVIYGVFFFFLPCPILPYPFLFPVSLKIFKKCCDDMSKTWRYSILFSQNTTQPVSQIIR